ncbi:MAG: alpha/beta fold hydrolase [Brevundimonas sp.]|nr:MAG: alpha/beta fold hydrolase [Brevundimonas sp.]
MTSNLPWTRRRALAAAGGLAGLSLAGAAPALARPITTEIPAEEGYAAVPGGKVFWRRFGSGPGRPLLLLHGGPGAAHNYLLSMTALGDERPVIVYDQLGCGRSDAPTDETLYTVQRSVDELEAVRESLGLGQVDLFGHSWGSALAIEYICQGRGRGVEKLVLGGALASVPQCSAGMQRLLAAMPDGLAGSLHALEDAGRTGTPEYAALAQKFYDKHLLRVPPTPDALATFESLATSIAYRVMNGPSEFNIIGVIRDWDRRADLAAITQQTLITTGEFDEITLDCHETIRDGVAGPAHLVVMTGCSHLTMVEQPGLYNALIRDFLRAA